MGALPLFASGETRNFHLHSLGASAKNGLALDT